MRRPWGRRWRGPIGYFLYTLILAALLFWLLLPTTAVQRFVELRLTSAFPTVRWQVGPVRLALPPGMSIHGIKGTGANNRILLQVDELRLQPQWLASLWQLRWRLGYQLTAGMGTVQGWVQAGDGLQAWQTAGNVQGLRLAACPMLAQQLGRAVDGTVTGTFAGTVTMDPTSEALEEMQARLELTNGRLGLQRPLLGERELVFQQAFVLLQGKGRDLRFDQGRVSTPLFDGSFSGRLSFNADPGQCRIDLAGEVQPTPGFYKARPNTVAMQAFRLQLKNNTLPFRVTGTLGEPGIHFGEFALLVHNLEEELK